MIYSSKNNVCREILRIAQLRRFHFVTHDAVVSDAQFSKFLHQPGHDGWVYGYGWMVIQSFWFSQNSTHQKTQDSPRNGLTYLFVANFTHLNNPANQIQVSHSSFSCVSQLFISHDWSHPFFLVTLHLQTYSHHHFHSLLPVSFLSQRSGPKREPKRTLLNSWSSPPFSLARASWKQANPSQKECMEPVLRKCLEM